MQGKRIVKNCCKAEEGEKHLNIAIVDDEKIIREQIKGLIEKQMKGCCQDICQPDAYETGDELLAAGKHFEISFRMKIDKRL